MAYLFKSINDQLQNQSNIFGGQQGAVADQGGSPQGGAIQKTSAQGEITSGGPVGQTEGMQTQGQQSAIQQLGRNQLGAEAFNPIVKNIQNSISTAGAGLQKEADSYVDSYKKQDYGIGEDVIKSAITNQGPEGSGAYSTVASRLANKTAPRVKEFNPNVDVSFSQLENMLSPATAGMELANYQDGSYTKGDRALDSNLLSRNPEFRKMTEAQRSSANKVRSDKDFFVTSKPVEAQGTADAAYKGATDRITDYLSTAEKALVDANQKELEAANAPLAEQRATPRNQDMLTSNVQGVLNDLRTSWPSSTTPQDQWEYRKGVDTSAINPDYGTQLPTVSFEDAVAHASEMGVDPVSYYSRTNPELLTLDQVISPDEQFQFNHINTLLGDGENWTSSAPNARNQLSESYDRDAYRNAIINSGRDLFRKRVGEVAGRQGPMPSNGPAVPGTLQINPTATGPIANPTSQITDPQMAGTLQINPDYIPYGAAPMMGQSGTTGSFGGATGSTGMQSGEQEILDRGYLDPNWQTRQANEFFPGIYSNMYA